MTVKLEPSFLSVNQRYNLIIIQQLSLSAERLMIIKSRRCKDTWKATESCEDGSLVQSLRVSHTQLNVLNSIFSEISNRH